MIKNILIFLICFNNLITVLINGEKTEMDVRNGRGINNLLRRNWNAPPTGRCKKIYNTVSYGEM